MPLGKVIKQVDLAEHCPPKSVSTGELLSHSSLRCSLLLFRPCSKVSFSFVFLLNVFLLPTSSTCLVFSVQVKMDRFMTRKKTFVNSTQKCVNAPYILNRMLWKTNLDRKRMLTFIHPWVKRTVLVPASGGYWFFFLCKKRKIFPKL